MRGGEPPLPPAGTPEHERTPQELTIEPWIDPLVEAQGFEPRSLYVEVCWLPVLGPTATWLYRRLGSLVELQAEPLTLDLRELSLSLGIGEGLSRNSPLTRSFERLTRFHVARWQGERLAVRRALAPLPESRAAHLSPSAYHLHRQLTAGRRDPGGPGSQP